MSVKKLLYTVAETSIITGLAPLQIRRLIHSGNLAAVRVGRQLLVHRHSLEQLMHVGCPEAQIQRKIDAGKRVSATPVEMAT